MGRGVGRVDPPGEPPRPGHAKPGTAPGLGAGGNAGEEGRATGGTVVRGRGILLPANDRPRVAGYRVRGERMAPVVTNAAESRTKKSPPRILVVDDEPTLI